MNPGPPTLEASTLPLGYRGGGFQLTVCISYNLLQSNYSSNILLDDELLSMFTCWLFVEVFH